MGASRKLQGEIDRVLKKVQEGVDVFDSIWNKVYDTDNANQKEKFEADLKKEIKKLQRYRDQIKTWIQSSEIKDKKVSASYEQALVDARKLIEREMERFKICEKETKTKAFSKEGLGQQPKTDPREKAKAETRDWLNNLVSELESQIDSFEAEMEGLTVKKGKTRPPRLTHLETSIQRHKAHIMKLELILRLLDNDELSAEQVNDVKDFIDDYVERNQDDFDEFSDVDELYSSLPLDKVESLEDLVATVPPGLVKGLPVHSLKSPSASAVPQLSVYSLQTAVSTVTVPEQLDDAASQDSNSDVVARTPPAKSSIIGSSVPSTPSASHSTPVSVPAHPFAAASAAPVASPGPTAARGTVENATAAVAIPSSPALPTTPAKDEEITGLPGHRPPSSLGDAGITRGIGRGGLTSQLAASTPFTSGTVPSNGSLGAVPLVSEMTKRNILASDDRIGNSGMGQSLNSPLSNRMILSQTGKANDGTVVDSGNEGAGLGGRVFSPPAVPGMQWRPGSSLQNPNEPGQLRARTEIAPDQREKFLQRYQQVQQGHGIGMQSLPGGTHKQFPTQQNPLLQQYNSQNSSLASPAALGLSSQAPGFNNPTAANLQQPSLIIQQSSQPDGGHSKIDEQQQSQQLPDDSASESAPMAGLGMSLAGEDELKAPHTHTTDAISSSLAEPVQVPRDADFSPGQPIQSTQQSTGLGVIGRRSIADLGAIGDNPAAAAVSPGAAHDNSYTLQILEAAYHKLPQPKDSERARSYLPRHPTVTPSSFPQVQAPIVNSPGFWERLTQDSYGTDTLFFAFYYQQNTYQQYLAARELKKGSWRYHRKYNTWFQRHEEPKVATDEYEQGTYVYFDFHIANDDHQHGWCQRIKTEFTFEYTFLEDELIV
ncbi:CCR4-NOT transcription complex subunit 3 [Linum grandiflorum]